VRRPVVAPRPWIRDFTPIALALALCPLVANLGDGDPAEAVARAHRVAHAEASLGLLVEPAVAGWVAGRAWLLGAATVAYLVLHVTALLAVLSWVYLCRAHAFGRVRAVFLAAQALTVAGYLLLPTAPPRLTPGAGFADSLAAVGGASLARSAALLQDPYAALPSGHVVFALVAGGSVATLARAPLARLLGAAYPVAMAGVTLATANHWWLDAASALTAVAVGTGAVLAAAWLRAGAARLRPAPGSPDPLTRAG
jgi:hypothetical protein